MTSMAKLMRPDPRYLTTIELIELNARAIEHGMGRTLDEYALLTLDPDGLHVGWRENRMFLPFCRMNLLLKVNGEEEPATGSTLDLPDEWYDELPTVRDYLQALKFYEEQSLNELRQRIEVEDG